MRYDDYASRGYGKDEQNVKKLIINLTVSVAAWLVFSLLYSLSHEEAAFSQTLMNHIGLCLAISAVYGAYMAVVKEKA